MKKIFMIIISAVLVILIVLGALGYYAEKDKSVEKEEIKAEETVQNEEKEETSLAIDVNKLDVSKIENYNSNENSTVIGIKLPYTISNKNMEIVSIGEYYGKFMEDGSDTKKDNILAVVIKNTSDKVISYGEVKLMNRKTSKTVKFVVTNLKPNASALVMESTGKVQFNADDNYVYVNSKSTTEDSLSLMEDEISITSKGRKITVKNTSNKDIDTVYVYYKIGTKGNAYLGGITYRAKFENVKKGKSVTANTLHFLKSNSEIIKVECVSAKDKK